MLFFPNDAGASKAGQGKTSNLAPESLCVWCACLWLNETVDSRLVENKITCNLERADLRLRWYSPYFADRVSNSTQGFFNKEGRPTTICWEKRLGTSPEEDQTEKAWLAW